MSNYGTATHHLRLLSAPTAAGLPVALGAGKAAIWISRLREAIGGALNRIMVPGAVRPMVYDDPVTGDRIQVNTDSLFTVLTVNGRDYYFKRLSGRFDGTGTCCR